MEVESLVFQSLIPTLLLDVDKSIAENRQETIKLVNKFTEKSEENRTKLEELIHNKTDIDKARKSKCDQIQKEVDLKKQKTEEMKLQLVKLKEEKRVIEYNLKKLGDLKITEKEIQDLTQQVEVLNAEVNLKKSSYKETNFALSKGIAFYKKYLQCNVFESDGLLVFSLDPSAKNISETQIYLRLKTEDESETFHIVDYMPKVPNLEKFRKECEESGDLQTFVRVFRKAVFKQTTIRSDCLDKKNVNMINGN